MEIVIMTIVTAVIFTIVGYLRVSGKGDNQIILKYDDTNENKP